MRCADEMQHWLAETLADRAEFVSYAIFFVFWPNESACCVCADVTARPLPGKVRFW